MALIGRSLAAEGPERLSRTTTAKDAYGNTATSYTAKNLTFTASGTATETSPGGSVPGVNNSAGTNVVFGGVTFTNGVATVASSKNGMLRLYPPGSASVSVGDATFTSAPVAFTVTAGVAKRVAITGLTASAGSVSTASFFTCAVTTLGNSGTIGAAFTITDEYGNEIAAIGRASQGGRGGSTQVAWTPRVRSATSSPRAGRDHSRPGRPHHLRDAASAGAAAGGSRDPGRDQRRLLQPDGARQPGGRLGGRA